MAQLNGSHMWPHVSTAAWAVLQGGPAQGTQPYPTAPYSDVVVTVTLLGYILALDLCWGPQQKEGLKCAEAGSTRMAKNGRCHFTPSPVQLWYAYRS
jgi:hypothetical protein